MTTTESRKTFADLGDRLPSGLLIGGAWVSSTSAGSGTHVDPTTGVSHATFPMAGPAEIDAAVHAAAKGLRVYRGWTGVQRRDLLRRIAEACVAHGDEFGTIATLECGMIASFAATMGQRLANWFEYYAGWADKLHGEVVPEAGGFNYTLVEPYGVVGVILTWNAPISSIGMKAAAALAAGCAVVLKPPELAPFGANLFARLAAEAGLPPGVLNVVPGGPDAGAALVQHPLVDKISFTGGPETGRSIQAAAARTLTPLVLELGGKSAQLVFADADLELASAAAAGGIVGLSGQVCVAPTRLLVDRAVYDEVVERVTANLAAVRIGDPFALTTQMGPVISGAACTRILGAIDAARERGDGRLHTGGTRLTGELSEGFFVAPTVFTDVDNSSSLAQHEVFGPVLSITTFDGETTAIAQANESEFGLAGYVYTRDLDRAHRVAARLDVGNVAVNGGNPVAGPYAPFGGFKQSGYGKEGSLAGIMEYTRIKNVNINVRG